MRDVLLAGAGHGGAGPAENLAIAGKVQEKELVNMQAIISSCSSTLPDSSAKAWRGKMSEECISVGCFACRRVSARCRACSRS